jgi:hypothetical protein
MKEAAQKGGLSREIDRYSYLSWVEMLENVVLSWVPRPFTTAMIATEMPAAIKPYSIAVAPDSSDRNCMILRMITPEWLP